MAYYTYLETTLCTFLLLSDGETLTGSYLLPDHQHALARRASGQESPDLPVFQDTKAQLTAYLSRQRTAFDLPLTIQGTPFQKAVWSELTKIPYGQTISYGALATRLGNPKAARAVGLANGKNPLSVIVPCHRVVGAQGELTGYGGGLERKEALLALERFATR